LTDLKALSSVCEQSVIASTKLYDLQVNVTICNCGFVSVLFVYVVLLFR